MDTHPTVIELRERGIEVKVEHLRLPDELVAGRQVDPIHRHDPRYSGVPLMPVREMAAYGYTLHQRGGLTRVTLSEQVDGWGATPRLTYADAACSLLDPYRRGLGLEIALGRAVKRRQEILERQRDTTPF